jgi:hypothetical protein
VREEHDRHPVPSQLGSSAAVRHPASGKGQS